MVWHNTPKTTLNNKVPQRGTLRYWGLKATSFKKKTCSISRWLSSLENIQKIHILASLYKSLQKTKYSYATYINFQSGLHERAFYSQLGRGVYWCWIAKWESPQNEHYCKWVCSIKWRCYPPFVDCFLHRLVEHIYPWLAFAIGQSWRSSKSILASSLHCYYEWP